MGTITPNISIFKPANGEELFNASFRLGLDNIDSHDHSGAPYDGVQIGTDGIQNGAITVAKLDTAIFNSASIHTTNATPTQAAFVSVVAAKSVTIQGRYVGLQDSTVGSVGGTFEGTFLRPAGGNIAAVSIPVVNVNGNISGNPGFEMVADVGLQAVSLRCVGAAGTEMDWQVNYNVLSQP